MSTRVLLEEEWVLTRKLSSPLDEVPASEVVDRLGALPFAATDGERVRRAINTC